MLEILIFLIEGLYRDGARLINLFRHKFYCMYATDSDIQIGVYPDLWQKGRYRAELAAQLACDFADVDTALSRSAELF